jgi:gliding motility-associated-like protein
MIHDHGRNEKELQNARVTLRSHTYNVKFIGSNAKAVPVADKPLVTNSNYFIGNDPSKWAANCKTYLGITIKDIYPDIDLRYYSENGALKYDFIVRPGADITDITLRYTGTQGLQVKNKELLVRTTVGEFRESAPYSYQFNEKGKVSVDVRYAVSDSTVRFSAKSYDPKVPLIIDPTMVFVSLSGSTADNWGFTATYGPDGSMYGGGIVFNRGFLTSPGAFQEDFQGGSAGCFSGPFDIGIIKLSPDGSNRIYATYIGGTANEMPQSLIVDPQGNLVVAGRSNSANYPVTAPLIGPGGAWDITITKLNATGSGIIGSRRFGGTGDDGANITPCGGGASSLQQNYGDESRSEVNLDGAGNIYLASCTRSTDLLIQNGFQANNRGQQDGVVLKFNPDLSSLLFSTYLGGSRNDAAYVLAIHPQNGNIYVAGGTESIGAAPAGLPGNTAGTIGTGNQGNIDGFVSIITPDGGSILTTTYLGTSGIDQVFGIQFDKAGFPYVMGQTTGTWPVRNATWAQPGGKQFISKLRPDLSNYVYSTTFGKGQALPDLSPVAFLVDRCENVYVSGWGGVVATNYPSAGVQGLPITPDAYKPTTDVNAQGQGQDFYFFVLKKDAASQLYGSYFGQNGGADHVDGGTSRFDQNGVIYQAICANCSNDNPYPTTNGAWRETKPTTANCNLAMVKMSFDFAGVASGVQSAINGVARDTAGCVPLTVEFRDTLMLGRRYEWNFGDGSGMVSTTTANTSYTYNRVGTYRVMLISIDSNTCNIRDTSYLNIKVGDVEATVGFAPQKLEPCNEFRYQFNNTSVAPPGTAFGAQTFTWDFGDGTPRVRAGLAPVNHNYRSPGTYNVRLFLNDSTFCNSPDSFVVQLRVSELVKAAIRTPSNGCAPYRAVFNNISSGGIQFIWRFEDGTTSNDVSPVRQYNTPGTYTISLIAIDSTTCNKIDSTSVTITIQSAPTADFTAAPQPPEENRPITFTNLSSPDAIRFKWLFGDGDSLVTTSRNPVLHEFNATRTYTTCLIATNQSGCVDTTCKQVQTLVSPAVDVPNAFTPLTNSENSIVFVRGFGFAKMRFTVWARWGEKVFETNDKRIGWDGRYKGKLLPMDVYAYTLDVEFSDGTKTTKKGDITLIR